MYYSVFNTGWARIVVAIQVVLAILICASVNGQDTLMSEEVKVLKDFDAQLSRISRIRNYPKPLERDSAIIREDIQPQSLSFEIPIYLDQLKYPFMDAPKGPAIYTSYVSLGGGFPRRFQLAAGHSIQNDGVFELMIKGRLDQAESKKVQYQGYKDQDMELAGRYFFDPEWDISFHSGVQRDVRYIYGHPFADSLNAAALRRRVTIYDLGLRGHFQDKESNRAIEVGLDFSQLQDSYATSERKVTMDGIYTPLKNDEHQVDIKLSLDFTSLSDTLLRKLNNYLLKPRYQYFSDNFTVVAALNIYNHRDVFKFYPDLEVKAPLSGNQMVAVLGVSGGLLKNDYHSLYRFNNFIQSRIDTLSNTGYINYYAGLEGSISGWQYSVRAGWKQMDNFALFQFENRDNNAGFFRVLFDDVNATYIQLQLLWEPSEELSIDMDLATYFYNPEEEQKAWHRSGLQYSALANWRPWGSNFSYTAKLWIESGIPYLKENQTAGSLGTIIDLSLEGRYQINESFDAFLQVNNLFSNNWTRWVNYPQFGANLLTGIRYRVKG